MGVPNTSLIVTVGSTPFGGDEANTTQKQAIQNDGPFHAWIYKMEMGLPLRNLNAFPPEKVRIHGPRARSEHRQCGAQSPKEDVHPRIGGMRESETQFRNSHQHTRDRRPQTKQQRHCETCRHHFQNALGPKRRGQQSFNPLYNNRNRCYRAD